MSQHTVPKKVRLEVVIVTNFLSRWMPIYASHFMSSVDQVSTIVVSTSLVSLVLYYIIFVTLSCAHSETYLVKLFSMIWIK